MDANDEIELALSKIDIPNSGDIRGNIHLPESLPGHPDVSVLWSSSRPGVINAEWQEAKAPGVVNRPQPGESAAAVTLTATVDTARTRLGRAFDVTVSARTPAAPLTRYAMMNFARSNSHEGQQIYASVSIGNDPTRWRAVNGGRAILTSSHGMLGVRDPSIVRSPEGDRFFLVATDLNVDATEHGWQGWDWAQSGASRAIEIWESDDLVNWSAQRHIIVAPETAGMAFAPEAIWEPSLGAYVVYWTSSLYPEGSAFTTDRADPNGRFPLTANRTMFATTRDFVHLSDARIMIDRPGTGTLDAFILREPETGRYHRFICDRTSTGVDVEKYIASCAAEDIYQESAASILAPAGDWEVVASGIASRALHATYAEAPMAIAANISDARGGYYLWADQIWPTSPAGEPGEEQLTPYWSATLTDPHWTPIEWQVPDYLHARGVLRHGTVLAISESEHEALTHINAEA